MTELETIIGQLKASGDVDAAFITGSHGLGEQKPYSDIDLVVILNSNDKKLRSVFTWIDGVFADVFFYDTADVNELLSADKITDSTLGGQGGMILDWVRKATIFFDKSGTLTKLKAAAKEAPAIAVSEKSKTAVWQKINHNLTTNKRYFNSGDPLYREALEMRLLYSVIEIITGYLTLRGIVWRGEKDAVKYLKANAPEFYALFQKYSRATTTEAKFELYTQMAGLTFTDELKKWEENSGTNLVMTNDFSVLAGDDTATEYAKTLLGK